MATPWRSPPESCPTIERGVNNFEVKPISRMSRFASASSRFTLSQPNGPASSLPMKMLRTIDCCTASARS